MIAFTVDSVLTWERKSGSASLAVSVKCEAVANIAEGKPGLSLFNQMVKVNKTGFSAISRA